MDSESKRSSLVVIDSKTMKELGRARMPIVMGYGFHGVWGHAS
jgi:torulene dioxygenase